jgi:dTDP-4-dehydrorhamnose 3,5-epimerase-like enzyme
MERVVTPIVGLEVGLNRVIGDARGWLGELVPGGVSNPDAKEGLGNVYLSVAIGRNIARAGHYHYRQSELFFTITGAALWVFKDFREDSKTFGAVYAAVFAAEDVPIGRAPTYRVGESMPYIVVPHGVYHVYWALSDTPVRVVCVATTPHDNADYVRLNPSEVAGLDDLVRPYGVIFQSISSLAI